MKRSDFDLQTGVDNVYWELDATEDPVDPERDLLREDLIQIALQNGTTLDVGWYPEFSRDGEFKVVLVANHDWGAPLRSTRCRTIRELHAIFGEFLAQARNTPPQDGAA
jgi:hypothetical protein